MCCEVGCSSRKSARRINCHNAGKISMWDHETIMEEAERRYRLECNDDDGIEEDKGEDSDDEEDECESGLEL